jgi:hypothetical protein
MVVTLVDNSDTDEGILQILRDLEPRITYRVFRTFAGEAASFRVAERS